MSVKKKNLDLYLGEVFKQFIAIKDDDYKKSQEVFKGVFDQVKQKMGEQCNYFGKYSSQVLYAGSVYDGIKVSKLDEFDMDIVIRLPINYDLGIAIENDVPGFLKLKIVDAFDNLDKQQEWEKCHKVTRDWRDADKYFLQNKFRQWMGGIVQRALNELNGSVTVNGVAYLIKNKESGPAYTLTIQNDVGNEEFKLDVDLVPVIKFQYPRWPEGYRTVEESIVKDWLVVPKPNKAMEDGKMKNRCWRLSFQDFERDMMKGCQQLKTTIRLIKKLRDSLKLKDIASYYIKTLFLLKIQEKKEKKYWQNRISVIFRIMVEELYNAIKNKNIPYFWHEGNNLIEKMKPTIQNLYANKLKEVLDSIDANNVDKVVFFLLNTEELNEFKNSDFYQKQLEIASSTSSVTSQISRQESVTSQTSNPESPKIEPRNDSSLEDLIKTMNDKLDRLCNDQKRLQVTESEVKSSKVLLKVLNDKIDMLSNKFDTLYEKLEKVEKDIEEKTETLNEKISALTDKVGNQKDKLKEFEMLNENCKELFDLHDAVEKITTQAEVLQLDHNQIRLTYNVESRDATCGVS